MANQLTGLPIKIDTSNTVLSTLPAIKGIVFYAASTGSHLGVYKETLASTSYNLSAFVTRGRVLPTEGIFCTPIPLGPAHHHWRFVFGAGCVLWVW